TPPKPDAIAGVSMDAVKSAIQQRLTGAMPKGVGADTWRHVRTLYANYAGAPLWLDTEGLSTERVTELANALASADSDAIRVDRSMQQIRPQDSGYASLRTELMHYRQLAAKGDWPTIPKGPALKPRQLDSRARLTALAGRLRAEGYLPSDSSAGAPDTETAPSTRVPDDRLLA